VGHSGKKPPDRIPSTYSLVLSLVPYFNKQILTSPRIKLDLPSVLVISIISNRVDVNTATSEDGRVLGL